jgi:glycosyltransferase involved in cell wall biosynthesis
LWVDGRLVRRHPLEDIRKRFGVPGSVHTSHLPLDRCTDTSPRPSPYWTVKDWLGRWGLRELNAHLRRETYDFIHLNSLVLHRLIREDFPVFIHVRELLTNNQAEVFRSLAKARGVIFIDRHTEAPFRDLRLPRTLVLNNPIDMTPPASRGPESNQEEEKAVVFGVFAYHAPVKGSEFLIDAFRRAGLPSAKLWLVGDWDPEYRRQCERRTGGDDRIAFLGYTDDARDLYARCDYVLRGEAYPCVGRTVYEALYAGCEVVVPGAPEDIARLYFETDRFREKIHPYAPRDPEALASLFRRLGERKVSGRKFLSNVPDYVNAFHSFILESLGERGGRP